MLPCAHLRPGPTHAVLLASNATTPRQAIPAGTPLPPDTVWIDLFDPTEAERDATEHATGLRVPQRAEIVEIESSSRLRHEGQGIYLSTPIASPNNDGTRTAAALGLVLSQRHLITLRYHKLPVFDRYAATLATPDTPAIPPCAATVFVGLIEAIIDRLADVLEHAGAELDTLSHRIFTDQDNVRPRNADARLRATLRRIGAGGDQLSLLRDSLLGLGRIVPYVTDATTAWLPDPLRPRLLTIRQDIVSLSDYAAQQLAKVQFLLDATLGFLNIAQNNGIKVLTVVSIVGIPPTLIASIYGMNFKDMPELQWAHGYAYGLTMIALSVLLPLLWFKLKGWL